MAGLHSHHSNGSHRNPRCTDDTDMKDKTDEEEHFDLANVILDFLSHKYSLISS